MNNFDDMTLEELQQLLQINTKDPEQVKRIQQLAGLTGNSVDGVWGGQTNNAWNKYMDANQSEIEDNIAELQAHQNAMGRGQTNPAVVDVVGYSNKLDEARNAKIAQLESQIAMVEERIARNERALTGKTYEDANNRIAALEMQKINSSDPTSFWRWNIARQDTKEANNQRNADAIKKFDNEIDKWENRNFDKNMTAQEVRQEIKNVENAIQEGKNIGAPVSRLEKVRQTLLDMLSSKGTTAIEDWNDKFNAFMTGVKNGKYTKAEIDDFRNKHQDDLSGEQSNELLDASLKAGKGEDAKAKAALEKKAIALFKKDRPSEDWEDVSENTKKKYRDLARGK